ncbi:tetraspanin-9 isoform X2 [Delphinapterus leucas]|uniref:Tetraspanin-9 n=1 Tax=Delphinapterus leucas TaxID=9749 RepID=A0A2Y9NNW4_DELLE|nr:tetraspanin-9 isoform X2 [Delphinapterus leucas]
MARLPACGAGWTDGPSPAICSGLFRCHGARAREALCCGAGHSPCFHVPALLPPCACSCHTWPNAQLDARDAHRELCGCGLLGVGVWLSVSQGNFATFSPSFPSLSAANLVIAIGTIVMVTGFLGCLGAIKENRCLLLSFFIVLLITLLAELILIILFFVYTDKVNENARKDLKEGLLLYNSENNVGLKNAWNIIQAEMRCCGVTDYTDWYPVLGENTVPDRCCMENSQGCGRNSSAPVWRTGCYEKVKMWFDDNKHVLGTVGMCILIVQILGMAFSMTLFQHIHRTGKKYDA